jgi:TolA-binding protein
MIKLLLTFISIILLSACSLFESFTEQVDLSDQTLQNLQPMKVRLMANEGFEVTHDEVMDKYRAYLEVSTDAELRVRTHHRIANLRLQQDEFIWQGGEDSDEAKIKIAEADLGRESINDYEALLAQYPDRNDNDLALYQLAKAYSLAGEPFETIRVLEQLAELYPRSDYYLEALFRLGEIYYANGVYDLAENAYQRLIGRGVEGNKYHLSAMYLIGWAQFKQNNYDDSLLSFTSVLDAEFPMANDIVSASISQQDMMKDILRIMAIIFDYQGDWQNISQFYAGIGGRHYEHLVYQTLASQYYDKKYYKSGASTLRAFIKRYPQDVLAPVYYQRVIEGYAKARYATLLRKHKKIFINTFAVGGDYWLNHSPAVQDSIKTALKSYIWDLARFNHAWGQRIKNKKEKKARLQEAIGWYTEYIRSFPVANDTAKAHFLLAEAAYQTKQYPLAKDHYEIVAYQYPEYEKAAESGYAAILTYSKHKARKPDKAIWRQLTVASAMRFVQEFPEDERRGQVLVNTSEMLLMDKYYEQALLTANLAWQSEGKLSARHRYGASLVRSHSSFQLEQFVEAEEAILEALSYKKVKASVRKDLREKLAASVYKQGEMAKLAGDDENAVKNWLRIADLVPESDIKVSAEFDAATLLMAAGQYDQAVSVLLQFRQNYPQHRLLRNIPSKLIVAYESQKKWDRAAFELQKIWQQGGNTDQPRIALFQAGEYFEKAGDLANALAMYKRYAHDYKRPFNPAIEAHHKLDQIYLAQGDDTKRLFWLNKIVWLHLGAKKDKTERSKYLAAKASYELAENERIKYDRVKITLPLDKSINKKNKRMKAALERYTQAVQIGVLEFTTSATFRIAELYSQFSEGLMASERPPGLDELELEEYGYLLEDQAFPLEEAAIEVHQTNAGRTFDGLYDQWVKKSFASLAELMPAQYAKFEKQVSYVDAIR